MGDHFGKTGIVNKLRPMSQNKQNFVNNITYDYD